MRSQASQVIKLATIRRLGQQEGSLALNNVFAGIPQEQFSWRERERGGGGNWEPRHQVPYVAKCCLQEVVGRLLRTLSRGTQ
jgi:hypothetical protein